MVRLPGDEEEGEEGGRGEGGPQRAKRRHLEHVQTLHDGSQVGRSCITMSCVHELYCHQTNVLVYTAILQVFTYNVLCIWKTSIGITILI